MPTMYMPVTDDRLELPLAPPFETKAAAARWGGFSKSAITKGCGARSGMKFVEVDVW